MISAVHEALPQIKTMYLCDIDVAKAEGIYVLAEDLHLQRMVSELVTGVLRTDNLVMIKAQPGTASGIAAAVDAAELPDVLGSLAGNDTILVIAQTAEDGERLEALINKLSNSHK